MACAAKRQGRPGWGGLDVWLLGCSAARLLLPSAHMTGPFAGSISLRPAALRMAFSFGSSVFMSFWSLVMSLVSSLESSLYTSYDCCVGRPSLDCTTPSSAPMRLLRRMG